MMGLSYLAYSSLFQLGQQALPVDCLTKYTISDDMVSNNMANFEEEN